MSSIREERSSKENRPKKSPDLRPHMKARSIFTILHIAKHFIGRLAIAVGVATIVLMGGALDGGVVTANQLATQGLLGLLAIGGGIIALALED